MRNLNQLAVEKRDAWRGNVAIVPLSIDQRPKDVARHVKQRGWDRIEQYWNGAEGSTGFDAPVMRAFVAAGVPELVIINRAGRIVWRGHPDDMSDRKDVATRIEEALQN